MLSGPRACPHLRSHKVTLCFLVSAHVANKRPFQGPLCPVFVLFVGDLAD